MADDSIPPNRPIITRRQAKALGLKRYFTGKPCKRGHLAEWGTASGACLDCQYERDRRRYHQNPKKKRDRSRGWREQNTEKARETVRRWRDKNQERGRESVRLWKQKNPERVRALGREYRHRLIKRDPEYFRTQYNRRRAKKTGAGGTFSASDITEIRGLQRNRCARCRKTLRGKPTDIDHITPLALGGSNDRKNLQLLHASCNRSKGARHPIDDMRRLGRLL